MRTLDTNTNLYYYFVFSELCTKEILTCRMCRRWVSQ